MQEILSIAGGTRENTLRRSQLAETQLQELVRNPGDGLLMQPRVANDPTFSHLFVAHLKLRLNKDQKVRAPLHQRWQGRQNQR